MPEDYQQARPCAIFFVLLARWQATISVSPVKILFIGDIVGGPGRSAVAALVPVLRQRHQLDAVIANAENAAGGSGITPKTAEEIFSGGVDVITFHPPYVGNREVRTLPLEVVGFEPLDSLTDHSPEGMGLIDRAAEEAWDRLVPGGWLLIEVSPDRSRRVATLLRRAGYHDVRSTKGGIAVTRVLTARA